MEAAGAQRRKAFLKAYAPYLVPVLVMGQHQGDLVAMASALGATLLIVVTCLLSASDAMRY